MDNLLYICDVRNGRSYINANVSVSTIFNNGQFFLKYYFLHDRISPLEEIQLVSITTSLFSIFIHQNTKGATVLYIYSILKERPKALLKNRLALPIHPQGVIFEHIFKTTFIYRCFFNIDYR